MAMDVVAGDLDLDPAIEKVEFKVTALAGDEAKVQALLRALKAVPRERTVYFYDTKELALKAKDLVLRARTTEGDKDDSTLKLRPGGLGAGEAWREVDDVRVEADVVGERTVNSVKLDGRPDPGEIAQVAAGERSVGSLFGGDQGQLYRDYAPDGISLAELSVLGPIYALVWDLENLGGFDHKLGVEQWTLPDASDFLELSFKADAGDADAARADFHILLNRLGIDVTGDPQPKTDRVLRFFADRL
jgi:uncharacterized protein YjbK